MGEAYCTIHTFLEAKYPLIQERMNRVCMGRFVDKFRDAQTMLIPPPDLIKSLCSGPITLANMEPTKRKLKALIFDAYLPTSKAWVDEENLHNVNGHKVAVSAEGDGIKIYGFNAKLDKEFISSSGTQCIWQLSGSGDLPIEGEFAPREFKERPERRPQRNGVDADKTIPVRMGPRKPRPERKVHEDAPEDSGVSGEGETFTLGSAEAQVLSSESQNSAELTPVDGGCIPCEKLGGYNKHPNREEIIEYVRDYVKFYEAKNKKCDDDFIEKINNIIHHKEIGDEAMNADEAEEKEKLEKRIAKKKEKYGDKYTEKKEEKKDDEKIRAENSVDFVSSTGSAEVDGGVMSIDDMPM